jgi:hypothetical protein
MDKTGESYTAARAVIVSRQRGRSPLPVAAVPRRRWAEIAGMSDRAVEAKTGHAWSEWVRELDEVAAHEKPHGEIARHLRTQCGLGSWWSQMIAVGYERIRGLREVGQQRDGAYRTSKSRTFGAALPVLFRLFAEARRRRAWLPAGLARIRTAVKDKSIRFDCDDGTQANVFFVSKGPAKTMIAIEHVKLRGRQDNERVKAFWQQRLDALAALVGEMRSAGPSRGTRRLLDPSVSGRYGEPR